MSKDEIQRKIQEAIADLPDRKRIRKLSLFGSHLHGTAKKDSDVDLLVEFEGVVTLFDLYDFEQAFSNSLNKKVDLVTPNSLSKYIRPKVLEEASILYEG